MNIKELRNSVQMRQTDLVRELNREGIAANVGDISRIENGIIETYLFLAYRAEEILKREFIRQDHKNATEAKNDACKHIAETVYNRIKEKSYTDYDDLAVVLQESDKRMIRKAVEHTRRRHPIVDREGGGWTIAETTADCDRQIQIYESKKRVYSLQETPLIAKKYELRRALYGRADTELLRDNSREREV